MSDRPLEQVSPWATKDIIFEGTGYTSAPRMILPAHLIDHRCQQSLFMLKGVVLWWRVFPCPVDVVNNRTIFLFWKARLSPTRMKVNGAMTSDCRQTTKSLPLLFYGNREGSTPLHHTPRHWQQREEQMLDFSGPSYLYLHCELHLSWEQTSVLIKITYVLYINGRFGMYNQQLCA